MMRIAAWLPVAWVCIQSAPAAGAEKASPAARAPEETSVCSACEKRMTIPYVRAAVVHTVMYAASASLWPEAYSPFLGAENRARFKKSWTSPPEYHFAPNVLSSDGDWWYFNLVLHGLFGSEMYLAARDWGRRPATAFVFAVFASTVWEYFIEAWAKQPSAIDLFFTPAFGALLGELRFRAVRATYRIRRRPIGLTLRILLDPFGELERTLMECSLGPY